MAENDDTGIVLTDAQKRARSRRNVGIAIALAALVFLFYVLTVFKLGGGVANRPL